VNAGFFAVLKVSPVVGRTLRAGEDAPGQDANVAILSHRFWTRRFGKDPGVVGSSITLNGEAHQVIGVLPAGTPFLDWADVFRPLMKPVIVGIAVGVAAALMLSRFIANLLCSMSRLAIRSPTPESL
jgi:MacB-like periplasmic core domain